MKKLPLFMCALAGCLAFTSCSDDDNNSNNNVSDDLTGTYQLTAVNAPTSQDYDSDGDSNTNLVLEGSCYNESWISFHNDGTYDESYTSSSSTDGGLTLDCDTQVSSGTYTQSGNTITTTRTEGEGNLNATFTFNSDSHTLTSSQSNGEYSGWNAITSLYANLTGNLNLTFTKYSDNDNNNGTGQNDDDNVSSSGMSSLVGNFDLSSYLVATAQNLDGDSDSSTNLATESSCYSDSNITFNSDGTYSEESSYSILGVGGLSLDCHTETTTGTWSRHGDNIVTRHLVGDFNVNTEYVFNSSSHTLTQTDDDAEYPTFNSVTSLFATLTGAANLTYTKD